MSDLISREAVLREFTCLSDDAFVINRKIQEIVKKLSSVEPERTSGKWINIDATHSKCDRCDAIFEIASENGEANYCPNCGAKMEVN